MSRSYDPEMDTLLGLLKLHEEADDSSPPLLDATDRAIINEAAKLGRIKGRHIGSALGLHRSTVWRRVKRLLDDEAYLHRLAATRATTADLPEQVSVALESGVKINGIPVFSIMGVRVDDPHFKKLAGSLLMTPGPSTGEPPPGARALEPDEYEKLRKMYSAKDDAPTTTTVEWKRPLAGDDHGGTLTIEGSGALPRGSLRWILSGQYSVRWRGSGPRRCLFCGRFIKQPTTGRRRLWCDDRCRKRAARRGKRAAPRGLIKA